MDHIGMHVRAIIKEKDRRTERGELMRYFLRQLNIERVRDGYSQLTMARVGLALQGIPTKDLYYLKRVCDDSLSFSKKFWWELNPKNHDEDAKKAQAAANKRKPGAQQLRSLSGKKKVYKKSPRKRSGESE
jgi:hypothetical protein